MSESARHISGIVVRVHGRTCYVDAGGREIESSIRGRLKRGRRESRSPVAVGDQVTLLLEDDERGSIEQVAARRSELLRHSPHNERITHVIAANVDQMFAVVSADKLAERLLALDKLLAAGVMQGLKPCIVVNKCDLASREAIDTLMAPYDAMALARYVTSARTGEGLAELRRALAARVSVFVGPSGVGKSSLLNALEPGLALRVGEVDRHGEGRHTTTHVSLLKVGEGRVVDTPGLRDFGLTNFNLEELSLFYPDFAAFREQCKFALCTHRHEPNCAVRAAAESGQIDAGRYERYLAILREAWNTSQRREY